MIYNKYNTQGDTQPLRSFAHLFVSNRGTFVLENSTLWCLGVKDESDSIQFFQDDDNPVNIYIQKAENEAGISRRHGFYRHKFVFVSLTLKEIFLELAFNNSTLDCPAKWAGIYIPLAYTEKGLKLLFDKVRIKNLSRFL